MSHGGQIFHFKLKQNLYIQYFYVYIYIYTIFILSYIYVILILPLLSELLENHNTKDKFNSSVMIKCLVYF